MESKKLAALLSSIVSELVLILLLLFPNATPLSFSSPYSDSWDHYSNYSSHFHQPFGGLLPLVGCLLARFEKVSEFPTFPRKRKRTHVSDCDLGSDSDSDCDSSRSRSRPGSQPGGAEIFLNWSPDFFVNSFRMTSSSFEWLAGLLEPLLDCRDPAGSRLDLSAELRLGIGLFRLATGGDYGSVSRQFGVSESAARFCTKHLCRVLCTNFRFWVGFPSEAELKSVSEDFESIAGLPNCCGVIGFTRFRFSTADGDNSIAVQLVVDSSLRILSIVACFPGRKDEGEVLRMSSLYEDVEGKKLLNSPMIDVNGTRVGQYLAGVEGYPLLPWIMVPFPGAESGTVEDNFNSAHNIACLHVHKTIASLKKWEVLSRSIDGEDFRNLVAFIGACSILHNALLMREDYSSLFEGSEDSLLDNRTSRETGNIMYEEVNPNGASRAIRSALASRAHEFRS
ncbi:hypothetical protein MLD38_023326 [Melastoma candidum]|uniref:Uncharacterized protein n=1 Tax=Melastoma candidum TaxID=119954 RepID=A0ACB9QLB0_9MYRT|nr:hypothetical protein MLD38_023326 [Melastoma candidum]